MEPLLTPLGKLLVIAGVIMVGVGLLFLWGEKIPYVGKLPGDIYLERGRVRIYFPLATSIVISVILTILVRVLIRR
jgi:hypothetical protein